MFWDGKPMSWMRIMSAISFRRLNPSWPLTVYISDVPSIPKAWKSHEMDDAEYDGKDHFPMLASLDAEIVRWPSPMERLAGAHAADFFRWEYLSTQGGLYSDFDILWVRSIDVLYESVCHADAMMCPSETDIAIGFLGGAKDCALWREVWKTAKKNFSKDSYQAAGAWALYQHTGTHNSKGNRSHACIDAFRRMYSSLTIVDAPPETVYPWNWDKVESIFSPTKIIPERCIGIHWFAGATLSHKWNMLLTEQNFRQFDNTFTRYAAMI